MPPEIVPHKLVNEIWREMDPAATWDAVAVDLLRKHIRAVIYDVVRNQRRDIQSPDGTIIVTNAPAYLPQARQRNETSVLVRSDRLTDKDYAYNLTLRRNQLAGGAVNEGKIQSMRRAHFKQPLVFVQPTVRRWKRPGQTAP
jgi:hypothetical protein